MSCAIPTRNNQAGMMKSQFMENITRRAKLKLRLPSPSNDVDVLAYDPGFSPIAEGT